VWGGYEGEGGCKTKGEIFTRNICFSSLAAKERLIFGANSYPVGKKRLEIGEKVRSRKKHLGGVGCFGPGEAEGKKGTVGVSRLNILSNE